MHSHILVKYLKKLLKNGLNSCCNGRCTRTKCSQCLKTTKRFCLNPCCNGRCTRTICPKAKTSSISCLNPCCNGRCTRTFTCWKLFDVFQHVLILVVMEDALAQNELIWPLMWCASLNPCCNGRCTRTHSYPVQMESIQCLNPCCNGRCTRTLLRIWITEFSRRS